MIIALIGDDDFNIKKRIASLLTELDPKWKDFNYHKFYGDTHLKSAINCALTPAFGDQKHKLVVVEDCHFGNWGEAALKLFELLPKIPSSIKLVFVATNIDKRLKVSKALLKHAMLVELNLAPPWRTDVISDAIATQAKALKLTLNRECLDYLTEAIGNNSARAESELTKLATYSATQKLTLQDIQELVPSQNQNSLQLAEAMRKNDPHKAMAWLNELLARGEMPIVIVRTLQTQFRTWLWVKSAIASGMKQDLEIAKFCNLGNPKRVYFLKQEVAKCTVASLTTAQRTLLELEVALKQGESPTQLMLPYILNVTRLF